MPKGVFTEEMRRKAGETRARNKAAREAERLRHLPPASAPNPIAYVPADTDPALTEDMPFDRYDDETEALIAEGLITREEVAKIKLDAQVRAEAERKAAARKKLLDRFVEQERAQVGLVPAEQTRRKWLDEMLDVQIILPYLKSPNSNVINHPDPIRIDGRQFHNGRNYTVTRAQAFTLFDLMGKARKHHAQTLGESPAYYDANRGAYSYMGGVPAGGTYLGSPTMERRGAA